MLVGICVHRCAEMLVGLLGILKAGGAYVPIDPAYPAERQAFMLTSSAAPVVDHQVALLARYRTATTAWSASIATCPRSRRGPPSRRRSSATPSNWPT